MSRSFKDQVIQQPGRRKLSFAEAKEKIIRTVKRKLIADGIVSDPAKARPRYDWHWGVGSKPGGVIQANTKGEAISQIKTALGIGIKGRLPAVVDIVRVIPNANSSKLVAASQIGELSL